MKPDDARTLKIETIDLVDAVVLKCKGELDFSNEAELTEALKTVLNRRPPHVCLDLRDLDFADTTVLRVLEAVEESAEERDTSLGMIPGSAVQRLLDVLGSSSEPLGGARGRYSRSRGRARPVGRGRPGHPRHHCSRTGERRL